MSNIVDPSFEDTRTEMVQMVEEKADKIIETGYIPTIIEKTADALAPSGNPHDYVSLTRYLMSRTDDGTIFEDGKYNQNREKYTDSKKMEVARTNLFFTSQAALESQSDGQMDKANKYAKYSQDVLQAWFIDEKTKMTPHLEFAQMVEGENTGNFFGIIEGDDLLSFVNQAQRLRDAKLLDEKIFAGVSQWFSTYLNWLTTSEKGLKEKETQNNQGTFYDLQIATIADFVGNEDLVRETLESAKSRIDRHITDTGEMPLESQRVDSYGYQLYNLYGYSKLASIGEKYNEDLWHYQAPNGGSLKKAFEHFSEGLPASSSRPIPEERVGQFYLTLRAAAKAYNETKYFDMPTTYFPDNTLADEITKSASDITKAIKP